MKTLIIIPTYNEEKNIKNTYDNLKKYNKKIDILVINDCSKDKTEKILIKNNIPHITLINNLGIGGAVQTGYKYADKHNYDIAIQFDGDGQHNAKYIKDLIKPIKNDTADMVIGSRFIKENYSDFKSTRIRRIGIKIISFFIKLVTKNKIYDTTSGFRAVNKKLIREFSKNYPVEYPEPISTTIVLKKGYIVKEIPTKMNQRKNGKSSINSWKNIYYMFNVILSIMTIKMGGDKNE